MYEAVTILIYKIFTKSLAYLQNLLCVAQQYDFFRSEHF